MRRGVLVAGAAGLLLAGCASPSEVAAVRKTLDSLPLPASVSQTAESVSKGGGDTTPGVQRTYRCTAGAQCGRQILAALRQAGWRYVDTSQNRTGALPSAVGAAGSLTVVPPSGTVAPVYLDWTADGTVTAQEDGRSA